MTQPIATQSPTPESSDVVELARSFLAPLRAASAEIDRDRRIPDGLVEELRRAGLFHLAFPREFGGLGADALETNRAVEEVSFGDASAGWWVMLAAQTIVFAGYLPQEHIEEIWGDHGMVAGTARPIGRAEATSTPADGYVVSGRWPFASGSSHAHWFAAECTVYDGSGEEPRRDARGEPVTRMTFVPRDQVTVHDTWFSTGLRGTASNDFSVDGAFVPAGRGFQVIVDRPVQPWAVIPQAVPLLFSDHGAHALGVARAALESALAIAADKRGWGNLPLREAPRVQAAVAEATVLIDSARSHFYRCLQEAQQAVDEGIEGDEGARRRARLRLAASHAARASVQAVDLLHGLFATSSIFTSSPLERAFRDIHTAAAHVMIGPLTYEAAGRVELGLEPEFPFF